MKNTIHNIVPPKAGERITESWISAVTQAANRSNLGLGYNGADEFASAKPSPYINPLMVKVRNNSGEIVNQYGVLKIETPRYTESSVYPQAGRDFSNYFVGSNPTGEETEEIVILDRDCPPGAVVPSVISGPTFTKVYVDPYDENAEDYRFAKSKRDEKRYLLAAASGPARIVWKQSGTGVKWAFVVLDRTGEQLPDFYGWLINSGFNLMANPEGSGSQAPVIGRVVGVHKNNWGSSTPEYIEVYPVGYNPDFKWFLPQGCPVRVSSNNPLKRPTIVETFIPDFYCTLYEDLSADSATGVRADIIQGLWEQCRWWGESWIQVWPSPLMCDGDVLETNTKVHARWFPQYNRMIVIAHDCCGSTGSNE